MRRRPLIAAPLLWWRLGDRKSRWLLTLLTAGLMVMAGFSLGAGLAGRPFGDFFAMWSFGRFALAHPVAQIYDPDTLERFQHVLSATSGRMPFSYPPFYLLALIPLGVAPIGLAWAIWSIGGLGAYLAAVFAGRWRSPAVPLVILAPATAVALIAGQTGLVLAALIIGGTRLLTRRPALAGVLFGAAAIKPQLGLLIPAALIAARAWRCLGAAAATVAALSLAATIAFGPAIWVAWSGALGRHWDLYVGQGNATQPKMITLIANLERLGLGSAAALGVQIAALVAAAVIIWIIFRRRTDSWAMAALLAGGFTATPYALLYDLPPMTFAILLAVSEMARADQAWGLAEILVLLLAYLTPYLLFLPAAPAVSGLVLALLFGVLARRALLAPRENPSGA